MRYFTTIYKRTGMAAAFAALLLMSVGCSRLEPSGETLQNQLGQTPEELPVLMDVYDKSVEADVYDPGSLRLP